MTVKTRVIQLFLEKTDNPYLPLSEDLRLQILPSIRDLPRCQKHHFAAFIRDASLLIVWQDDPKLLLAKGTSIENQLMDLIWRSDQIFDSEKAGKDVDIKLEEVSSNLPDEAGVEASRKLKLNSSILVALTLLIMVAAIGAGWREVAIEIAVDGSLVRLAFIAVVPFQMWLALVRKASTLSLPS